MRKENMLRNKTKMKSICLWSTVVKVIFIPISLITSWLLSEVVAYAMAGEVDAIIRYSILVIVLLFISVMLRTGCQSAINKLHARFINECRFLFLRELLENSPDRLYQADHGELIENLNDDITFYINRYIKLYPDILSSALTLIGYMIFLALESPAVAVSLLVISLFQLFPPLIVKKYMKVTYDECREFEAQITDHVVEAVKGFEIIKLYGLKRWWQGNMAAYHKKYLAAGNKSEAAATAQRSMYKMLDNILKFGTYALIGIYVILKYCSIDTAIQALYLSSGLFGAVKSVFSMIPEFAISNNAEKRLDKWNVQDRIIQSDLNVPTKGIVLKNLQYGYGYKPIIDEKNFHFDAEKNYVLIGSNGSGKTTLLNLLVGLLNPSDGKVAIDGQSPCYVSDDNRIHTIFYIPQDDPIYSFHASILFQMFNDEIQERIRYYATRFKLTDSNIHETPICHLSGGERKKVFLSVAFAVRPTWLLLDEPSNSLDVHGKNVLFGLIQERKGTIVVSHDKLFQEKADNVLILKMESGRLFYEKQ